MSECYHLERENQQTEFLLKIANMKVSQLILLLGSASAQLDMDAFMKALMAKDPKQVQAFKQRLMAMPVRSQRPTKQQARTTRKAKTTTVAPTTTERSIPQGPARFNYRADRRPVAPVIPTWLKKDKKERQVIDLTKKAKKEPETKKKTVEKKRPPTAATIRATKPAPIATLNRKVNNHVKIAAPLSAGGRFFGYKSMVNDIPAAPAITSPFDIDGQGVKMAMSEKQVFGRGTYARSSSKTSRCFSCQGGTYESCLAAGKVETCMSDETACFVREYTQQNGIVGVYMGCQNVFQCVSDFNANAPATSQGLEMPDIAGLTVRGGYSTSAACKPGEAGSVCHQCCSQGDECNRAWVQTQLDTLAEWLNFDV